MGDSGMTNALKISCLSLLVLRKWCTFQRRENPVLQSLSLAGRVLVTDAQVVYRLKAFDLRRFV